MWLFKLVIILSPIILEIFFKKIKKTVRIVLFGIYPYTCFRGHVFAVRLDVTCQSVASIFFILSYSIILYQWIKMYLTARAFIKNREFMPTSVINLPLKLTMLCIN